MKIAKWLLVSGLLGTTTAMAQNAALENFKQNGFSVSFQNISKNLAMKTGERGHWCDAAKNYDRLILDVAGVIRDKSYLCSNAPAGSSSCRITNTDVPSFQRYKENLQIDMRDAERRCR